MNYKELLVSALVALVVATGVIYLVPSNRTVREVVKEIREEQENKLGAIPGVEVSGDTLVINGVRTVVKTQKFNQATSTLCALRSPENATSTLLYASFIWNATSTVNGVGNPATSTVNLDIAKITENTGTSSAFATSSTNVLGSNIVWSGTRSMAIIASGTPVAGVVTDGGVQRAGTDVYDQLVQYFVVKGSVAGAGDYRDFRPSGRCVAVWQTID